MTNHSLLLEALAELKPELDALAKRNMIPAESSLTEALHEFGPMPPEALLLGVASDGLPVLLNLHDPIPGPILIVGDAGCGKTAMLKMIAKAAAKMHQPTELQFGVLTNYPDEWESVKDLPNCVSIFPLYTKGAEDFILSLASWAHGNKNNKQSLLLLLDGFDVANDLDFDARQNLRWLLLRGPDRRVWPIITLGTNRIADSMPWLEVFTTRIFGHIENLKISNMLGAEGDAALYQLQAGNQFTLREGNHWLRYLIPTLD